MSRATRWARSRLPRHYVSDDGRYTAELRPAGTYHDVGTGDEPVRLTRHYVIRSAGQTTILGTARTLADAERYLLT